MVSAFLSLRYIAWVADQDAYACSGQKCSAQSICFIHENWMRRHPSGRKHMDSMGGSRGGDIAGENLVDRMAELASHRKLSDLSIGPVLSHSTPEIQAHMDRLLSIDGAYLAFGGNELEGHSAPPQYGMMEPTAVFVPLEELLSEEHFEVR